MLFYVYQFWFDGQVPFIFLDDDHDLSKILSWVWKEWAGKGSFNFDTMTFANIWFPRKVLASWRLN